MLVNEIASRTEKADPFHSDNAPSTLQLSSPPFAGRLSIDPHACNKADRKSLIVDQRIWLSSGGGRKTLCVFTDGSKTHRAAGWAVTGIHAGVTLFSYKLRFAIKASAHDAEMMALAHASKLILETMLGKPDIREFRIFSDSTSALTSIFDPAPHAMQQASLMFRSNMLKIFSSLPSVSGEALWTPGHGGLDAMRITDSNAKSAANSRLPLVFPLFISRSAALSDIEVLALREWHSHLDTLEDTKTLGVRVPGNRWEHVRNIEGTHWGQGVVYRAGTSQVHCKEMDNVSSIYPLGTSQVHSEFSQPISMQFSQPRK